ncbi:TRAP transporter small permease [Petroclostridium xylanilyticum]|uniref:TRAP transporter small permease n=1 Tax=Petroclostridium xylanilyticum TaxID=1792311 RepID=UPI001FA88634|nr:TRAP transporter small permease [Petroclostridium xylanilyticum]
MLKFLDKHLEDYILVAFMAIMSVVIFFQVIMRYVFRSSLTWSEELARYLFVWIVYFAISYAVKERKHIKIEAALYLMPKNVRPYMPIIGDIIVFVFSAFIIVTSWEIVLRQASGGQISPAMRIPMQYIYAAPFVGFTLTAFRTIQVIILRIKNLKSGVEMHD